MTHFLRWPVVILAAAMAIIAAGCSGDEEEDKLGPVYGLLYPAELVFPTSGGQQSVAFLEKTQSNVRLESFDSWITVNQLSTDNYSIRVEPNNGALRVGYVRFLIEKYDMISQLVVTQLGNSENVPGGGNTGGGNTGGGNTGGGNTGGGNTGGGNTGGGNTGGGSTAEKPAAPTGLTATPDGPSVAPYASVRWNDVNGATGYTVFRSTSSSGSYSRIASTKSSAYNDEGVSYGRTYYYKVKATNSYGSSDFSNWVECEFKDRRKPGPAEYGRCTVSGTTMTLRWTVPNDPSYGKPTKAILKVKSPDNDKYAVLEELSGNATSASFTFTPWVDASGYVRAGIILENENGSSGGTPKIYDTKKKQWVN